MQGTTELCIFDGIMDAELYTNILDSSLLPFIQHKYSDSHRFMADNDPKHPSKLAQSFLAEKNVKEYMRREVKPKNKEELINGIMKFWNTVTPEVCTKYIRHLKKVIPKCIERQGHPTGY